MEIKFRLLYLPTSGHDEFGIQRYGGVRSTLMGFTVLLQTNVAIYFLSIRCQERYNASIKYCPKQNAFTLKRRLGQTDAVSSPHKRVSLMPRYAEQFGQQDDGFLYPMYTTGIGPRCVKL